ncbi:MAG: FCD domain-containing protein, partial [Halomonadaceae bacterium]|nr:FCD domain-containing protein [Halomonadaceae bacterium]
SSMRPGRAEEALHEHFCIVEAIRAGDADAAEHAMRKHISSARISTMEAWCSQPPVAKKEVDSIPSAQSDTALEICVNG